MTVGTMHAHPPRASNASQVDTQLSSVSVSLEKDVPR
jgi:hypothetical protein